jgi:hypothetical protein
MRTYVDIYFNANGEKATRIFDLLSEMGLKYNIGEHDFCYEWKGIVDISEELAFIEAIQNKLKGTGAFLKFTSVR